MPISKTQDVDYSEDPGDLSIKRLLSSPNSNDRAKGIERLDEDKREQMFLRIRCWSNTFGWRLHGQDLSEIWQATLITIWREVNPERFEQENGPLDPFIRKITFHRACDLLRHRDWGNGDIDWESVIDSRYEGPHELPKAKFRSLIRARFEKLSPTEKVVIRHLVRLFRINKKFSLQALEASINENRNEGAQLSKDAVKSAKARAFRKLRGKGEQKTGERK